MLSPSACLHPFPPLLFLSYSNNCNDHYFHQSIRILFFTNHHQVIHILSFVFSSSCVFSNFPTFPEVYCNFRCFLIVCCRSSHRLPLCRSTSLPPRSLPSSTRASSRCLRPPAARSITLVSVCESQQDASAALGEH